ncbi:MAG: SDR family oxidoreductase [Candidatus Adiutrix sp.]|jgi:3-oxoacyl-[acyl-carrier protein] reductase|nr:SDR family oxidoreductase [Candidatus Adiutrix sp.]
MLLKGKTAIITGAARGIGRATLAAFAAEGADIYAHARAETPEFLADMREVAAGSGVDIRPLCFDLTDPRAMKAVVKNLTIEKRPIDVLVNNAGVSHNALFQMTDEETLRRQFEVNFFALFFFTQYISKLMVRRKSGVIINVASTAGLDGNPGKSAYGPSKAAVIALTKSIAAELGGYGVRANCIAPGVTATDMLKTLPARALEEAINSAALRRTGLPAEIAAAAVFLASDLSGYITGQVIRVDGGLK